MKAIATVMFTIIVLVVFGLIGAAAWSMNEVVLRDDRQIIAATTNCTKDGMTLSVFKQGQQPNNPCDDRELARLMLLSGMEEESRFKQCSTGTALRTYATVENCLRYRELGSQAVIEAVQRKSQECGGKPKSWRLIKRRKYDECMERLI